MKKLLLTLVAVIVFGFSANAETSNTTNKQTEIINSTTEICAARELVGVVTNVDNQYKNNSGWSYIHYNIDNNTSKTGWITVRITWTDDNREQQVFEKRSAFNITQSGKANERHGVKNYNCCVRVEAWFDN